MAGAVGDRLVGGGVGGGEMQRRRSGKRRDLHQAPFSSLEELTAPQHTSRSLLHPRTPPPHPGLLRPGPLPPAPRASLLRGEDEDPRDAGPARAPARDRAAAALSRGRPGPLPMAPRPRPAAPAARDRLTRYPGAVPGSQLQAPRGLKCVGLVVGDGGEGPGRPRKGRGRSGSAAISCGRSRQGTRASGG